MGTAEATYAQHAVWFTEQAGVAGTAYHMALGVWFADGLDPAAVIGPVVIAGLLFAAGCWLFNRRDLR